MIISPETNGPIGTKTYSNDVCEVLKLSFCFDMSYKVATIDNSLFWMAETTCPKHLLFGVNNVKSSTKEILISYGSYKNNGCHGQFLFLIGWNLIKSSPFKEQVQMMFLSWQKKPTSMSNSWFWLAEMLETISY